MSFFKTVCFKAVRREAGMCGPWLTRFSELEGRKAKSQQMPPEPSLPPMSRKGAVPGVTGTSQNTQKTISSLKGSSLALPSSCSGNLDSDLQNPPPPSAVAFCFYPARCLSTRAHPHLVSHPLPSVYYHYSSPGLGLCIGSVCNGKKKHLEKMQKKKFFFCCCS